MDKYTKALRALASADFECCDPDDIEAVYELVEMFEPYEGDEAEEAKKRNPMTAVCKNCEYEFAALFAPASLERVGKSGQRHAACPRCFCTTIHIKQSRVPVYDEAPDGPEATDEG